jgi:hypothetical protein
MTAASALTTFLCYLKKQALTLTSDIRHIATSIDFDVTLPSRPWIVETAVWRGVRHVMVSTLLYTLLLHATPWHTIARVLSCVRFSLRGANWSLETVRSSSIKFDRPGLQVAANAAYLQFPTGNHWDPLGTMAPGETHHKTGLRSVPWSVASKMCGMLRCGAQEKQTAR